VALNPVVEKHLREALRELEHQRAELDTNIDQLKRMISGSEAGISVTAELVGPQAHFELSNDEPAPPMREAILEFLSSADRAFATNDVAIALQQRYGWQKSSTRSLLSKMGNAKEVHMVRRGVYESLERAAQRTLDAISVPTHASGPNSAVTEEEPEDHVTPSEEGDPGGRT